VHKWTATSGEHTYALGHIQQSVVLAHCSGSGQPCMRSLA
jgi:hypothetical protein